MSLLRLAVVALLGIGLVGAVRPEKSRAGANAAKQWRRADPQNATVDGGGDEEIGGLNKQNTQIKTAAQQVDFASFLFGLKPTMFFSVVVCVAILAAMVVNQIARTLICTSGLVQGTITDWVWPIVAICGLSLHSLWLYNVVLETKEYAVSILMVMAVAWWLGTFLYEVYVKAVPLCESKEKFVAGDVYSDLTDTMFNVAIRFMMQALMMLILIHVAQEAVDSGSPHDVSHERVVINFVMAVTLELYLFVNCKEHTTWEDLRRLRGVRAVKFSDAAACGDSLHSVVYVAPGDFYVRFAMSVVITGVFHKFLVLAYPLLVFTTFARDQWVVLLKDILAITIVVQLDNLGRPVTFATFHDAAAVADED